MDDQALRLSDVLREEYVRLHGDLLADTVAALDAAADEKARLKAIYAAIHRLEPDKARTALCISGGGIRSATFALGVMQRLASFGLLKEFHFLSTISGGGYIGSWLSSFARRNPGGIADVEAGIRGIPAPARDPLEPEIEPLMWLRRFSNYLTPKLGLLSGDTWAFFGSYLRNLLLVSLMFIPFLASLLALPRLAIALLRLHVRGGTDVADVSAMAAGVLILIGTVVVALTRPVSYREKGWLTNGLFQRWVLFPYVTAALLLVLNWGVRHDEHVQWGWVFAGFIGISVASSLLYMIRFFRAVYHERQGNVRSESTKGKYAWKKFLAEMLASSTAGAVAAGLIYASSRVFKDPLLPVEVPDLTWWETIPARLVAAPGELFLSFGVPLVLAILFLQSAIFVAGASWFNEEYDREWWGRAAGWVLLSGVLWIAGTAIVIYGPVLIYEAPRIFAALTTGTGLVSVLLGKSGSTAANASEKDETASPKSAISGVVLGLIAPVFAVCVLALISLATSKIVNRYDPPPAIPADKLAIAVTGTHQITGTVPLDSGRSRNFQTSRFPAAEQDRINAAEHLWAVDRTTWQTGLLLVFGLAFWAWFVSFFIGANQFSMHGLYRNRLIRAYLGASRYSRKANAFSGFDPNDNLPMHRLRPELFWTSTFRDIAADGKTIAADPILKDFIQPETTEAVVAAAAEPKREELCQVARDLLADDLNRAVESLELGSPGQLPQTVVNRLELERHFPGVFQPMELHQRPLHVIGTCLNLVGGDNLAWQERKGATFAFSPLFTGGLDVGYRPTQDFGGPTGVSLGTAVAISGAAASPNMGYNSSPALSFLLTLFNVRLGWWFGNPRKPTYQNRNPSNTLKTVLDEALGMTNENHDYVYLSDGGHFDNLGLYEMVLRRCRCIIVSDAGADPDYSFGDLGNAIRKIRIDLGIDIVITNMDLFPRNAATPPSLPKYCAVATIRYSDVDPGAPDGHLLYLKPAFYGKSEPRDVYNYAAQFPAFPHQSTGDQWFSESQFESYRQLGHFALGEVASGKTTFNRVCDLIAEATGYLREKEAAEAEASRESKEN